MSPVTYEGQRIRLVDLVSLDDPPFLRDHIFRDCTLVGPAVLLVLSNNEFKNSIFDPSQFWVVETGRGYLGAIGLERTTLERCRFEHVGIASNRETIEAFFE